MSVVVPWARLTARKGTLHPFANRTFDSLCETFGQAMDLVEV